MSKGVRPRSRWCSSACRSCSCLDSIFAPLEAVLVGVSEECAPSQQKRKRWCRHLQRICGAKPIWEVIAFTGRFDHELARKAVERKHGRAAGRRGREETACGSWRDTEASRQQKHACAGRPRRPRHVNIQPQTPWPCPLLCWSCGCGGAPQLAVLKRWLVLSLPSHQ